VFDVDNNAVIEELKKIIEEIKNDEFQGVLYYSNNNEKRGFIKTNKGNAQDRFLMISTAWIEMLYEPNQKSRDWFFDNMYEIFKLLKPRTIKADRSMIV